MVCAAAESMLVQDLETSFQKHMDAVYSQTSLHLLEVLHTQYKFMDHLKVVGWMCVCTNGW